MTTATDPLQIHGLPDHVASWSAARIRGFVAAVLERWRRHRGDLPECFTMVICPQSEISARGGLPARVRHLTSPRLRFQHFTGCHKPYLVLLHTGDDAGVWREELQNHLAWSESYQAHCADGLLRLDFIAAIEEP
jgi:hypothetical protein